MKTFIFKIVLLNMVLVRLFWNVFISGDVARCKQLENIADTSWETDFATVQQIRKF